MEFESKIKSSTVWPNYQAHCDTENSFMRHFIR